MRESNCPVPASWFGPHPWGRLRRCCRVSGTQCAFAVLLPFWRRRCIPPLGIAWPQIRQMCGMENVNVFLKQSTAQHSIILNPVIFALSLSHIWQVETSLVSTWLSLTLLLGWKRLFLLPSVSSNAACWMAAMSWAGMLANSYFLLFKVMPGPTL